MEPWIELILALLAAFGLCSLGWQLFGRLLIPIRWSPTIYAVVPATGDGQALEQAVKGFLWLHHSNIEQMVLLIADQGLTEEGYQLAQRLTQEPSVLLCPAEELPHYIISTN